jgi:hypothetical protein
MLAGDQGQLNRVAVGMDVDRNRGRAGAQFVPAFDRADELDP